MSTNEENNKAVADGNSEEIISEHQKTVEIEEYKEEIAYLKQTNQTLMRQGGELVKVQTILQSLLHSSTDPIIQFDKDGLIINFNSSAERVFGYSEIELMYQTAERLIPTPPQFNNNIPAFLIQCAKQNHNKTGVLAIMGLRQDKHQLCLECSLSQIVSDDMILFDDFAEDEVEHEALDIEVAEYDSVLVILRDVSERVKSERKLVEAVDNMEKALSIKTDFITTISHELRTPMNGIIGGLQIIKDSQLNNEQLSLISTISSSSETLLDIINDVLDFSKIEAGKMQITKDEFNLVELTENTMELFLILATDKNIALNYLLSTTTPKILIGDQVKIKQILLNLIGNAVKFTEKGFVDIEINSENSSNNHCMLEIKVKDSGIGISKENQQRLFQPFSQADSSITREFGGTGLGLSICKKIIDLMGGKISLFSNEGVGSTITVKLPLTRSSSIEHDEIFSDNTYAGKRILIVTSIEKHADILSSRCNHWGLEITTANDNNDAISQLSKSQFDWAIVEPAEEDNQSLYLHFLNCKTKPVIILIGKLEQKENLYENWKKLDYKFVTHPVLTQNLKQALSEKIINKPKLVNEKADISAPICITDDNAVNRIVLQKILKKLGCSNIYLAKDGQEVVELCKTETIDLIFMDLQMPVMGGIKASKIILNTKSEDSKKPIIIALTANVSVEDKTSCKDAGMQGFLSKPVRIEKIQAILANHLA